MLPVVFNGVIAEVDVQDAVNIVAQGDGIELMNPILDDREAHTVEQMMIFHQAPLQTEILLKI